LPVVNGETTIRVLHVDDEPGFGEMVAEFLKREDDRFAVSTETSASGGLNRLANGDEFDCIVSDFDIRGKTESNSSNTSGTTIRIFRSSCLRARAPSRSPATRFRREPRTTSRRAAEATSIRYSPIGW